MNVQLRLVSVGRRLAQSEALRLEREGVWEKPFIVQDRPDALSASTLMQM